MLLTQPSLATFGFIQAAAMKVINEKRTQHHDVFPHIIAEDPEPAFPDQGEQNIYDDPYISTPSLCVSSGRPRPEETHTRNSLILALAYLIILLLMEQVTS